MTEHNKSNNKTELTPEVQDFYKQIKAVQEHTPHPTIYTALINELNETRNTKHKTSKFIFRDITITYAFFMLYLFFYRYGA